MNRRVLWIVEELSHVTEGKWTALVDDAYFDRTDADEAAAEWRFKIGSKAKLRVRKYIPASKK